MADIYNPGTIGHGSLQVTINSVAYRAEDITPTDNTVKKTRSNETGAYSDVILVQGEKTASLTLQLATATTAIPENGMTFKKDLFRSGFEPTWVIENVSAPKAMGDIHKCTITVVNDPSITETAVA